MGDGASKPADNYSRRTRDTYSYWDTAGGGRPLSGGGGYGSHDLYLTRYNPPGGYGDVSPVYDPLYRSQRAWDAPPSPYDPLYGTQSYASSPSYGSQSYGWNRGPEVGAVDPYWPEPLRSNMLPQTASFQAAQAPVNDWQGVGMRDRSDFSRYDTFTPRAPAGYSQQSMADWTGRPALAGNLKAAAAPQPQDTVLIWDWDDTLMCSTAINTGQVGQYQVPQLDSLLEQVLSLSLRLGETIIVTNADELWVSSSGRQYAPHAAPLVTGIRVVSARRKYEHLFPGDPFAWKREAFREVLASRRNGLYGLNLVVLGDSPAEMEAAQSSTAGMANALVKTVKFKDLPTADDLTDQLRVIAQELPAICAEEKSCSRNLSQFLRYGGGRPSALPQAPTLPMSSSFVPPVASMAIPTSTYLGLGTRSVLSPMAAQA
mmetsp:Transcript_28764/g.52416  ORF Transcript_28764/g.52416 Transcript_28764/m.52416 type:complete len:429 (-) Transcript_28764:187-1473(-)